MEYLTELVTTVPEGTSPAKVDELRAAEAVRAAELAKAILNNQVPPDLMRRLARIISFIACSTTTADKLAPPASLSGINADKCKWLQSVFTII